MRLITVLILAPTILAPTAALAQTNQTPATYTIPAASQDCPVGFYASRQAGLRVTTASEAKTQGNGQGLHLTLNHLAKPDIQKIEVTVYATSLKLRSLPLDTRSDDTISKTFELTRQTGADSLQEADIWMQRGRVHPLSQPHLHYLLRWHLLARHPEPHLPRHSVQLRAHHQPIANQRSPPQRDSPLALPLISHCGGETSGYFLINSNTLNYLQNSSSKTPQKPLVKSKIPQP